MIFRWTTALLAGLLLLAACGGGVDRTKAQLRLVNVSTGYARLDLAVHGQQRQSGVAYAANAGYVEVDPGEADSVITSTGSSTTLLSFTPSVSKNRYYSIVSYGAAGALGQVLIDENVGQPDSGKALLTVLNAAADAGAVDVYLTGSADALASSVPVQSAAAVGSAGTALTVNSGSYRLRITAAGSKTDVRLDLPAFALASRQVATLVLTSGAGGVMVNALLLAQQGDITRLDGTQARVRVAAGVAGGGAVTASVASTVLLNSVGSPAVGLYTLVAAGSQAVAVAVNGTALAASTMTLAAGADYTLLVYGPLAAPLPAWIADDNRAPTDTSQARLRLVNGVASLATPLAMTIDFVPLPDTAAPGLASGYTLTPATTTGQISVTAAGLSTPLFSAGSQTLVAGGTYSLFVLGAPGSVVGVLRKDR